MTKRSRRQFLEESMLATAAAVAAASPSRLVGAEKQVVSPNDKLNVAVVGVNGRGKSHLDELVDRDRKRETQITHICDADEAVGMRQVANVAEHQPHKPMFVQDIRKLLEDQSIDIVTIATPNHWHSLAAIWAMQAGKDVYVEKPVSHNVLEGRVTVSVAREQKRICQTGTQSRSNSGMRGAIEFVQSGGIGTCKVARGLCYKRRPSIGDRGTYEPPKSVNYDVWLGPAPKEPVTRPRFHYDWHWQWAYGNGDLGNQGIHQMDLARWGLGVDQLSNAVLSYGGRFGYVDAGETANTQVVIHDYGDKTLVFEVRGLPTDDLKGAHVGVIFEGTDGYVVMSSYSSGVAFDRSGKKFREFKGGGDHFQNFLAAVRSRNQADLTADILEGHLSSALCHMGNISYRLGQPTEVGQIREKLKDLKVNDDVAETLDRTLAHLNANGVDSSKSLFGFGPYLQFDPARETFRDNDQANTMLTREYRAPYVVPSPVHV
jgi:predicted dehydrogenase